MLVSDDDPRSGHFYQGTRADLAPRDLLEASLGVTRGEVGFDHEGQ